MSNFRIFRYETWSDSVFPGFNWCSPLVLAEMCDRFVEMDEANKCAGGSEPECGWWTYERHDAVVDSGFYETYEERVANKAAALIEEWVTDTNKSIINKMSLCMLNAKFTDADTLIMDISVDYKELYAFIKSRESHFEEWLKNHFTPEFNYDPPIPNNFKELRRNKNMWRFLIEYFVQYSVGAFDDPDSEDYDNKYAHWEYSYIDSMEYKLVEYAESTYINMVLEKEKNNELVSCC